MMFDWNDVKVPAGRQQAGTGSTFSWVGRVRAVERPTQSGNRIRYVTSQTALISTFEGINRIKCWTIQYSSSGSVNSSDSVMYFILLDWNV